MAKKLSNINIHFVTIPNIINLIDETLQGKDRYNMSQRIRMFFRKLEDEAIAERQERNEDEDVVYKIDFKKVEL